MSSFIEEFKSRGFFHQCTAIDELTKITSEGKIVAYGGFDCTAPSLHVGNLILIMILRLLQKHGHKPIVLVGGGTTKVGDPSGRDETRKLLSDADIAHNMAGIKAQLSKFIKFGDGESDAVIVNNADWLDNINYTSFLRDYGRHFSINRMLSFDSVKLRLEREQNLSFLEFNYMLLQAYDFTVLNKKYNCRLQLGGSDQWGNIVNGVELARKLKLPEIFGLTTPLLTTASGAKMGKSVSGAVWLSEEMLPVYDYYQYWRNVEDQDTIKFLKLFTDLSVEEIDQLSSLKGAEINEAKKLLAYAVTKLCHGKEKADLVANTAKQLFEQNIIGDSLPMIFVEEQELVAGIPICELFNRANLTKSNGDSRRLIKGKGARINDITIEDDNKLITKDDIISDIIKLSSGKKNHVVIKIK